MKFKIAVAAILNLLFLSILVTRSIFSGSPLHYCKISFINVNRGWVIAVCAKIQDGGRRHFRFYVYSIFSLLATPVAMATNFGTKWVI